jgi:hypothetical protein
MLKNGIQNKTKLFLIERQSSCHYFKKKTDGKLSFLIQVPCNFAIHVVSILYKSATYMCKRNFIGFSGTHKLHNNPDHFGTLNGAD